MKRILPILTILAFMSGPAIADDSAARLITVTGEGQVDAEPDMATITLGVTHEAEDAKAAMDAVSDAVRQVLAGLEAQGIAARDLQTRQLNLSPVWSNVTRSNAPGEPDAREITGFRASNTVMVRIRDLDGLGGVLDEVLSNGANTFNGLRFGIQDMDPLVASARDAAVKDGIAKAEALAQAAGVTLGPVQSISELGGRPQPMMMEMAAARSSADVPIAAGEVSLQTQVSMVFAITD